MPLSAMLSLATSRSKTAPGFTAARWLRVLTRHGLFLWWLAGVALPQARAQWTNVPPPNFSSINLNQFSDQELEVPYYLYHFAQVANAVVETGTNRGWLDIKVNREPVDNQPYNARVMENQVSLAYFYTANRPWNFYRGNHAVRVRLEAMLQRWTQMQNQPGPADGDFDGLFTEYSWSNWSLAPTGFGVRHAAEALHLLHTSGLPFDATVFDAARTALRRALMALFTRTDMRNAARQYSNQFSGSYHAAMIYLQHWPDAELDAALLAAVNASATQDQSPTGYWYEQGGPDFGYTGVHESNMRIALTRLRARPDLMSVMVPDDEEWNLWQAVNYVPQPGLATRTFLEPAGLNTRTSDALLQPESHPWSEFVEPSRIFSLTDAEYAAALVAKRNYEQGRFGNYGTLAVPSSSSYIPAFVHGAVSNLNTWHPTAAQRLAAEALLACKSPTNFNRQYRDPLPLTVTYAKRPQYYAAVATDKIRVSRQVYGLGLLWNPTFGIALQSVAGTLSSNSRVFGTKQNGMTSTYETADLYSSFTVNGAPVTPQTGIRILANGDLSIQYPLATGGTTYGQKTITLGESAVTVSLTHTGDFTESLPLAHASDVIVTSALNRVEFRRPNGSWFSLEVLSPGATIFVGNTSSLISGLVRRAVTLSANGQLTYRLQLSDGTATLEAIADAAATGGNTPCLVDVLANDVAINTTATLAQVTAPAHGTATLQDQHVWYVPAARFTGVDTFNYVITNGTLNATGAVSVTVGGPTLPIAPGQVSASADDGNIPANTLDGNLDTRWSALGDPQWIQFDLLSTQRVDAVSIAFYLGASRASFFELLLSDDGVNWTTNFSGQSSGTTTNLERFELPDRWTRFVRYLGHGNSASAWNSLTEFRVHAGTNEAPVALDDTGATLAGTPLDVDVLANDSDPDNGPQALSLLSISSPAHGTVTPVGVGIRYQPNPGYAGVDTLTYVIGDSGLTATGTVNVTVTNLPNLPPVLAAIPDQNVYAGDTLLVSSSATDPDEPAQQLVYSLIHAPAGATIDPTHGLITWEPPAEATGTSNLFTVVVTENGWTTNVAPQADAYVRDGTYSNINYGADPNLFVKASATVSQARESYLRFPVLPVPGTLAQATLRLLPLSTSLPGIQAVKEVADNAWVENLITWSNRPASGAILGTWLPQAGVSASADLTAAAQAALVSDQLLSLSIVATNTTADGLVQYGAREGSEAAAPMLALHSTNYSALSVTQSFWVTVLPPVINNPPLITAVSNQQMIAGATLVQPVEAEDPAQPPQRLWFSLLTSPPGATINTTNGDIAWRPTMAQAGTSNLFTVTVTENGWWTNVSPLADAYVRDGIYSNANYGADASLFVKASATAGQARESYLRFPVAPLPGSLASATLELTPLSTSLPGTHAAALLTNDAWLENAITWSNRPSSGAPLATWLPQTGVRTSAAVNLAAQEAMNSDQLLSLRVYATNTTADGLVQYGSREGVADQAPALVLYSTNFSALSATQSFWVAVRLPAAPQITAAGWSHGQFRLHIAGDAGPDYRMVASTNLRDWTLVETVTPGSLPMLWTDPDTNPWSQRYYRIELGP